ncbi:MAG: acetylxylan esterase [Saprospiraceae bacterium]|nr:acetylxylan esterase [Saprospiraceae bacterium]
MIKLTNNLLTNLLTSVCLILPALLSAQITVKTERLNAQYKVGERATFIIQQAGNGTASYSIKYANSLNLPPLSTGTVQVSGGVGYVNYTATEAGFVHCVVSQYGNSSYCGAAFSPYSIEPVEAEPSDFDAFWSARKAELASIPLSANVSFRGQNQYVTQYNYNIGLTDGRRAYGYLNVPKGAGSYPAVIQLPPYGNQANIVGDNNSLAERAGVISIYLNIHNNNPSQAGPNDYLRTNILDPKNYYLKYAILGVIKTIDYLQTRRDFNGQIGVIGVSQGGGLAILAAGIDNRISLLVNTYPALCAHPNMKYNKPSGFPNYWRGALTTRQDPNAVLKTVKYYDAVTAAKRFKGVSWTMVGYRDDLCYPTTSFEAYNQLKGQKIMTHFLNNTHGQNPAEFAAPSLPIGLYSMLRRHFPNANNPPFPFVTKTLGYSIDAGSDVSISSNRFLLRGSVLLENTNANFPVRWEKKEGIGTVSFDNPNALSTNVTFSQAGVYRLRLVAEDISALTSEAKYSTLSDDIVINVGTIPVELINFTGQLVPTGTVLKWSTASEFNNKYFELEHSTDGIAWKLTARVSGKGNSNTLTNYAYTDGSIFSIVYYRLKQIDGDGKFKYSKTISLTRNRDASIDIFPNPVGRDLTVKINETVTKAQVRLFDLAGKLWLTQTFNTAQRTFNIGYLPRGKYFLHVNYNGGRVIIKSFVKE